MVWWRFKKDMVFPSLVFVFLLLISPQFTFAADSKPIDLIKTGAERALKFCASLKVESALFAAKAGRKS